jgi:hypothetical protein
MILQKKQFYAHLTFTASVSATCRDFTQGAQCFSLVRMDE